jgi:outer membrane protein TolC
MPSFARAYAASVGGRPRRARPIFVSAFLGASLAGCASFSPDGGLGPSTEIAREAFGREATAIRSEEDANAAQSRTAKLLKRPLSASAAVEVALLSNRGLQAAYNRLGVEDALRARESLPPNPTIAFSRVAGSLSSEIEAAVAADILALATLPARTEIAEERFEAAKLEAAEATMRTGAEARRAWVRAVGAREKIRALEQAAKAAESAAKFAEQLGQTGAMNKLDQSRNQVFYAEVTAQLAGARQQALAERERLVRALGLWGSDLSFTLPDALPAPPAQPRELPAIEREAVDHRLDLQVARKRFSVLAKSLGLTQSTRFVGLFELAARGKITRENVNGERVIFNDPGVGAVIEIPIFDLGETRLREAEQRWLESLNLLAERAVNVRSQAREAYRNYRAAHEIARHQTREILPLYETITQESLRRYNAMLVDVFALIDSARRRMVATAAAIDAKRDFWLADVELQTAVIGGGRDPSEKTASAAPVSEAGGDQQ